MLPDADPPVESSEICASPETPMSPSPPSPSPGSSRFTYRDFHQLAKYSVDSPLRVIAHIDLDAFYAQCEMKRTGVAADVPLAVQQWQNLIAVNYAARPSGVTRHISAEEARKLCPDLKLVHVAVWKAGEEHWAYCDDRPPDITKCKACLDPYRAESKKILKIFKAACPDAMLEKASIDESFLDLSKVVYEKMLEDYEVLRQPPPGDDPLQQLPLPEQRVLDWHGSHLVASEVEDNEIGEKEEEFVDWDDIAMAEAAKMVRFVRGEVERELGYTCSAGISSNKMIAKLGSGFRKPNQQSVVRPRAIAPFLSTFSFTKIRNLGGKLGTQISTHFSTTSLPELLTKPLSAFQSILPDDTATWVYNIIRGIDKSPVTPRSAIKSMLSAKSFRPPALPTNPEQVKAWLKVFVADIFARIEDECETVPRRPKVMALSFASKAGVSRIRQAAIPSGGKLDKDLLLKTAEGLLAMQVSAEGSAMWPCIRLSLNVSNFEEKEAGNGDIGAFLLRGAQAKEQKQREKERPMQSMFTRDGRKRLADPGIARFFAPRADTPTDSAAEPSPGAGSSVVEETPPRGDDASPPLQENGADYEIPTFPCEKCNAPIPVGEEDEHRDWHFAKELAEEERRSASASASAPESRPRSAPPQQGKKRKGRVDPKLEKGQKRLAFG